MNKNYLLSFLFVSTFTFSSFVSAQCTDGRVPCSHKCEQSQRPACTDSRGSGGKQYCTTAAFCRDAVATVSCEKGWSFSNNKCSDSDRRKGCQDKRANGGNGYCLRYR